MAAPFPIDVHYAPTPNGWKISIFCEEAALPHRIVPVNIHAGEQDLPAFRAISPNGRIPAIVDPDGPGGEPLAIFESGAILVYLAEKNGKFLGTDPRTRSLVLQWLFWQVGGLGPMVGQNGHFLLYAPERLPYPTERYGREVRRLYAVLDGQLARTGSFVAGEYSIADMACFPWILTHKKQGLTLDDYPALKRWFAEVRARPAVQRGLAAGGGVDAMRKPMDVQAKQALFGAGGNDDGKRNPDAT